MKFKFMKRLLAGALAGIMALSMVACGGKTNEQASKNDEPVELIWYIVGGGKAKDHDKVMEKLNEKLVEKINVKLDLRCLGWGEYDEQMKLISTGNEEYDLCFTSNWMNSFTDNISRDAFLDITELYEEYGKDIAAQLPEWVIDVGRVNGKLYGITNFQGLGGSLGVCIQKDLADKYNINVADMETYEGLEKVMDVIVENEPDMIPISTLDHYILAEDKYESFANGMVFVEIGDESLKCVGIDVAYEDDLRLRNEWYKKGYIREDIATNSDESPYFADKKFAILMNGYKEGVEAEYKASYGIDWVQSTTSKDGDATPFVTSSAGLDTLTAINVNSKHPVEAMKLLNLVYTDKEIYNMLISGLEGVHYNKVDDNRIEYIYNDENARDYEYCDWELGNVFLGYRTPGKADETVEDVVAKIETYEVSNLRGFAFDPSNVQSELAQLAAVVEEFKNMEYVTNDIDQLIADRNAKLKSAGLERVVEEVQKQMNEWAKNK